MKKKPSTSPEARALRQQAEERMRERPAMTDWPLNETDTRALVHELQVHQIELEMQNDELLRTQAEARQAAEKYAELFDFAPVAYFVIYPLGVIREVNLAGAALLGLDRQRVIGHQLEPFVAPLSRTAFSEFWRSLRPGEGRRSCEVRLLRHGQGSCDVLVEAIVVEDGSAGLRGYRLAVTDITDRKRAEETLRQFNSELERKVAERTTQVGARNAQLERFNHAMVGREVRMVELKKEINELCRQAGQPPRYPDHSEPEPPAPSPWQPT